MPSSHDNSASPAATKTSSSTARPGARVWRRNVGALQLLRNAGILAIYLYYSVADGGLGLNKEIARSALLAPTVAPSTSPRLWARGSPTACSARRVLFGSAIVIVATTSPALLPGAWGVGVGLVLVALGSASNRHRRRRETLRAWTTPAATPGSRLFYLGINFRSFFGPILTGLLQSRVGFHWGFGLAARHDRRARAVFAFGRKNPPRRTNGMSAAAWQVSAGSRHCGGRSCSDRGSRADGVIRADNIALVVIIVVIGATIAYFVLITSSRKITSDERSRVFAFVPLFIASVAFWSLYQQQFTVLVVYPTCASTAPCLAGRCRSRG